MALTETDIALYCPRLAKSGFGASQLHQIVEALRKLGKSSEYVIEGLSRAEWELEHGIMIDGEKKAVESPKDYVFKALARTGYYRMPKGYVSPEERAIREATQEAERQAKATQALIDAEFEIWWLSLSPEDTKALLPNYTQPLFGPAARAMLKPHFREHVWPEILAAKSFGQPTPCAHRALSGAGQGLCPSEPREDERQEPEA